MARKKHENDEDITRIPGEPLPNPAWFKPVMIAFFLIGLLWVLVFYMSSSQFPVPGIGAWNLAIGGALAFIGLIMATRWR